MDIIKTFDCIDRDILLTKLKRNSVHSTPLRWINNYVINNYVEILSLCNISVYQIRLSKVSLFVARTLKMNFKFN